MPSSFFCTSALLGVLLALTSACTSQGPVASTGSLDGLLTVAEASGFQRTARHTEVVAFLDELALLSERVTRFEFGRSQEGRELPAIWLTAEANPTADKIRSSSKPLVLLYGNIHAGEVCGKEALLWLARELCTGDPVLEDLNLAIVPIYNADGNELMAPDNRPGQVGPEQMGTRANAQGLDLNRDWTKAEASETRAFLAFLNEFDPEVIVDTHTTNGSLHRYALTYQGPKHPAGDAELIEFGRTEFLPAVARRMADREGYASTFYGNFDRNRERWEGYPAQPRFGAVYRGLRNRLTILTEAYSYDPYETRVRSTLAFCRAILEQTAQRAAAIQQLLARADQRTVELGRAASDEVAVKAVQTAYGPVTIAGFEELPDPTGEHPLGIVPGEPLDREVELWNRYEPSVTVQRPRAYLLSPGAALLVQQLDLHGIQYRSLEEPPRLDATLLRIKSLTRAGREFQGHRRIESVELETAPLSLEVGAGWTLVPTDQPLGTLAVILCEPASEDGWLAWNFLDPWCMEGEQLPIYRLSGPASDQP